jgi:single-stranded-DNA-specific exonuclease
MKFKQRSFNLANAQSLERSGLHPLMARIFAARGIDRPDQLDSDLKYMHKPQDLKGTDEASNLLLQAYEKQWRICVVADYDCDGATACSLAISGLRLLGFNKLCYLVPDRQKDGYGLTESIARRVFELGANLLITVDNGIGSIEGVGKAQALGMKVLITDHHLPFSQLPSADAIVNPNQPGCQFPSKHLAGVGVMFYVLLALRGRMRELGFFEHQDLPRLDGLLPLVALGTVADMVFLDQNNRILIEQGLMRIRRSQMPLGLSALFEASARNCRQATAQDLGFFIGPRINAAGRLADMGVGIACLLSQDETQSFKLAQQLNQMNQQRKEIETGMREQAQTIIEQFQFAEGELPAGLCVFNSDFHEGVIGIVAGRLKEIHRRPCFVFARSHAQSQASQQHGVALLKGSGRSIGGFHLRDALDTLSKKNPGLLIQFGGHSMAAGCTLAESKLETFKKMFEELAIELIDESATQHSLLTDGELTKDDLNLGLARLLANQVWGQGFEMPVFCNQFQVISQRILGHKHLSLLLELNGSSFKAIWFNHAEPVSGHVNLAYRPQINEWQGQENLQLEIQAVEPQT